MTTLQYFIIQYPVLAAIIVSIAALVVAPLVIAAWVALTDVRDDVLTGGMVRQDGVDARKFKKPSKE